MEAEMTAADIARKAAEIASERGHCKHVEEDHEGHVCFVGALNLAYCGHSFRQTAIGDSHPIITVLKQAAKVLDERDVQIPGPRFLTDVSAPIYWNNQESTTGEDVVMLLKETAEALEAA